MNALYYIVVIVVSILLVGCAGGERDSSLLFRELAKGTFSGIQEERQAVLREPEEWGKFWVEHARGHLPEGDPPPVNFESEMVVAVTMGQRPTGGYEIAIDQVLEEGGQVVVRVVRRTPPEDAMLIQAMTAPFHFVAVPRSRHPARFVVGEAEQSAP
jgi:hypothetical protein